MAKHVAVLMGGWSAEREVSLRSGKACADALARLGYAVTAIDAGRDVAAALTKAGPDVALNVLHGRPGEDGTLQGVLEILGIPYSHSGVLASAVAMHKGYAKAIFRAADIPVAEDIVASRSRSRGAPSHAAALCHQADGGRLQRRRLHGHRRASASAAGALPRRLGVRRTDPDRALHPGQGTDLRGHRRSGARCHRHRAGDAVSTITRRNTPPAAPATSFQRKFYQMFTRRSADSLWLPTTRLAAAA